MKKKKLSLLLLAVIIVCLMGCGKEVKAEKIQKLSKIQQQRADKIAEIIIENYEEYGCLPSVCLGQAMQESRMGKRCYRNNLWGLHGGYRSYATLEDGVIAYMKCINNGRYKKAPFNKDVGTYIDSIIKGGYCSDPNYKKEVLQHIKTYDFKRYDNKMFNQLEKEKERQKKLAEERKKNKQMKRGKRLTRNQKESVSNNGLDPNSWMFVSETEFYMRIVRKGTSEYRTIDKYAQRRR